ncbi:hypothetical protein B0H14DRAFT_2726052 [Mycena olivaceomarginata]|nr:hypothetical protein B0H14DRAFT_2726052 [Mycena olivaceomarginata]
MFEIPCILSLLACCFNSPHPAAATSRNTSHAFAFQTSTTTSSTIFSNRCSILPSSHVMLPSTAFRKCLYQC